MREAPEPADDVGVVLGVFQVFGSRRLSANSSMQRNWSAQMLRMHEGQIEEFAQRRIDPRVGAAVDGAARDLARQGVARIGQRVVAKHVAGKLVEHDVERQRAVIARLP